jgi:hypothetical protein
VPLSLHPDAAENLASAIIAASNAPVVLLDGELKVVAASTSFLHDFGLDAAATRGSG